MSGSPVWIREGEEAGTPTSPKKMWACSSGPLMFLTQENSRPQFLSEAVERIQIRAFVGLKTEQFSMKTKL